MDVVTVGSLAKDPKVRCCQGLSHPREWRVWIAVKWAFGKLSEIPQLRSADFTMARTESFANSKRRGEEHRFVAVGTLDQLHPINRKSAEEKTEARRQAAREARAILEANDWVLSEALIQEHPELAAFKSITGICVVRRNARFDALEGNGRLIALRDVYPELTVEVREYLYSEEDHKTLLDWVDRTRRAYGIDKVAQSSLHRT